MSLPETTQRSDLSRSSQDKASTATGTQTTPKVATATTLTSEVASRTDSDISSPTHLDSASTLLTSVLPSTLITADPSDDVDTTISWAPAATASTLPSTESGSLEAGPVSGQANGSMSSGARQTLIATTTIGGTLILAFLIYALWRRRRGATYSEIVHFRPRSSIITLSPGPSRPNITALPIYRESRYSVRSDKRGSKLSFSKLMQRAAPSPSSESFARGAWLRNPWKQPTPPTPTRSGHPLSQVMTLPEPPSPPLVKPPEMAHVHPTGQSSRIHIDRTASEGDISKPWPTVSAHEVQTSPLMETSRNTPPPPDSPKSDTHLQDDSRWSWTNSQAPPTPRIRTRSPSRRTSRSSSIASMPRFRKVQSWVRNQSDRAAELIEEEQRAPPSSRPSVAAKPPPKLPPLKNKASKPVLAPVSAPTTRRLSKKGGPPPSSSSSSRPATAVTSGGVHPVPRTAG